MEEESPAEENLRNEGKVQTKTKSRPKGDRQPEGKPQAEGKNQVGEESPAEENLRNEGKAQTKEKSRPKGKRQPEGKPQAEGKKQVEEESPAEENLRNEGKVQTKTKSRPKGDRQPEGKPQAEGKNQVGEESPAEENLRNEGKAQTKEKSRPKGKRQPEGKPQAEGKKQVEEESPAEENLRNEGKAQTEEKSQDIEENPPEEQQTQQENLPVPIIGVRNVTMKFRIATGSTSGLKDYLIQKIKKQISTRELMALDHVSFDVFKGEVVGIIGTNGSGKSTLLKIVSGALNPSEGSVSVDKKKVQMLSLGAGFDVELSARENVYLNGAIIGYTKEFINRNYDKIVEFSELEGFMDEKVKNFSSGMVSRLAFAIATVGEAAEILILDEVLSVGDEFFKKKSLARVKEMIHGGSTVLMVSHGMSTILDNCTKVVWIEKGKLQMVGEPKAVCAAYRNQFG